MDLSVAVMASCDAVCGTRLHHLIVFEFAEFQTLVFKSGLQKPAAAAAAVIIGAIGLHVDEIFFSDHRLYDEPQVLGDGITEGLTNDLTGILYCEFNLKILVPVRVDVQFAFTNPLGVVFVNVFDFKVVLDVEFFQSCQD